MYQYESKKPLKSAKSTSSDKGKTIDSSRRVFSNSPHFPHSRQLDTIQRSRFSTVTPTETEEQYGAGSARLSFDELPAFFPEVRTNSRQTPENIRSSSPIITAAVPTSDHQYGAEVEGRVDERTAAYFDDLEFIDDVLSKNHGRDLIGSDENISSRAEQIRSRWETFLPKFLLENGFKPYGACQSLTYHRPPNDSATGAGGCCDERNNSKIGEIYKSSSGKRTPREYIGDEEIKRYLRHCAAALAINFGVEHEIQCYYDNNIVYVATNNDTDLTELLKINGRKVSECSQVLQYSYKKIIQREAENDNSAIWDNFQDKLNDAILSDKKYQPLLRRLRHPLTCPASLKDATFQVIENNFGIRGLHAERKILYYLRKTKKNNEFFLTLCSSAEYADPALFARRCVSRRCHKYIPDLSGFQTPPPSPETSTKCF